jgi:DNA-binding MarR family transcriptional regulator
MLDEEAVRTIIGALESASDSIRHAADALRGTLEQGALDGHERTEQYANAVMRAKEIHPALGPRQAEILEELEIAGADGTTTGVIFRKIGYPQPDVYLTLRGLVTRGLAEKDESASPQRYRLASALRS